ncbi:MAG: cysteine synthase A [Ruminococcaceae bacterium]|nr:cysteine synthase A [Oscillospiraceae bacterium]
MSRIYSCADELIGKTPLLRLSRIEKDLGFDAAILAKLEYFNPAGSVKDRAAKAMLDAAEARGELVHGSVIIEPTSGNTGIGLCSVAATRGYKVIIVMPDSMSEERRKLMRAYGAELVLTDGALGMAGAIARAEELAREIPNSFIPNQFENADNARAHFLTTGPEIWNDTDGEVDIFVAGVGTGGTVTGVGEYLKSKNENVRIVAVEPQGSPFLSESRAGAHKLQGIGAGFVPKVLNTEIYDEIITVGDGEAMELARMVGKREGVLVGISSGAALAAAVRLAKREENRGKNIVVLLPDTGDRYLSTELFGD